MIEPQAIREIIAVYQKHGWGLRRVLLTAALRDRAASDVDALFGKVAVRASDIDAAWFSRPPRVGPVAWEIRYLGEPAFALLESVDESDADFENALKHLETRLRESIASKSSA